MSLIGQKLKLRDSGYVKIQKFLQVGGEGKVYLAKHLKSGQRGVVKIFHNNYPREDREKRTSWLIDQDFGKRFCLLNPPTDMLNESNVWGHYSPYIDGQNLETYFTGKGIDYYENVCISISIACAIAFLHEQGIAFADIHSGNFMIRTQKTPGRVAAIDFDNFKAPNLPDPFGIGHELYMAPEHRQPSQNGKRSVPNIYSDRFCLAALLHETLLLKCLASGFDASKEAFAQAMASGVWQQHPKRKPPKEAIGFPVQILNQRIMSLFDQGVSLKPEERPSALQWAQELQRSFQEMYIHDTCNGPVFIDRSQTHCPHCKRPYKPLKLVFKGFEIRLDAPTTPITRDKLKSTKVSRDHAIITRIGPDTQIQSKGANGTYRKNKTTKKWITFKPGIPISINPGDILQFADVSCTVKTA